jgi:hypothetical protein
MIIFEDANEPNLSAFYEIGQITKVYICNLFTPTMPKPSSHD